MIKLSIVMTNYGEAINCYDKAIGIDPQRFFNRCDPGVLICQPLKADPDNDNYRSPINQVVVSQDLTPEYNSESYNDFKLFIPYSALNMDPGVWNLSYVVCIWDKSSLPYHTIAGTPPVDFQYLQPTI